MELGLQLGWVQSAQPTMKILRLVRVKHLGNPLKPKVVYYYLFIIFKVYYLSFYL